MGQATIIASTIAAALAPAPTSEVPAGTVNGTNAVFTLSFTPNPTISLMLVLNGVVQNPVVDYSISGVTITFVVAPLASDWMLAYYSH